MAETETTTTKPSATPQTKTGFVLSIPRDVPAADVVAKAKAAGITLSLNGVHKIRSIAKLSRKKKNAKKKAAKAPVASTAAPAKKTAAPAKKAAPAAKAPAKAAPKRRRRGRSNPKKAFITAQPRTMPAMEVVAAAKKAGLSVSLDYVYKTRSKSGAPKAAAAAPAAAPAKRRGGRPKGSKNKVKSPSSGVTATVVKTTPVGPTAARDANMEHVLARFVVMHGGGRVREVLAAVEARVTQLFGNA
ncbi:MAG: hypothetical protein ACHREM_22585 [Polyangiales bacterium]